MKFFSWKVWLILSLLWLSAFIYLLSYLIFRDVSSMSRLFLGQLAFLPISVLIVTFVINQLLTGHAKRAKLAKLNMVIGAFFSDVGIHLLRLIATYDLQSNDLGSQVKSISTWTDNDFQVRGKEIALYQGEIVVNRKNLGEIRDFLKDKKDFLLRLIENPNLLEHDSFSDLLLAVFHLAEELGQRQDLGQSPRPDLDHLAGDVQRV